MTYYNHYNHPHFTIHLDDGPHVIETVPLIDGDTYFRVHVLDTGGYYYEGFTGWQTTYGLPRDPLSGTRALMRAIDLWHVNPMGMGLEEFLELTLGATCP